MLATAGAIVYESVRRIVFVTVQGEVSPWTVAVMLVSIGIDLLRSPLLAAPPDHVRTDLCRAIASPNGCRGTPWPPRHQGHPPSPPRIT